jgi:hypothetical protein
LISSFFLFLTATSGLSGSSAGIALNRTRRAAVGQSVDIKIDPNAVAGHWLAQFSEYQ